MKVQIIFVLLATVFISAAHSKSPAQFFCGGRLADTMAAICPFQEKRSGHMPRVGHIGSEDYEGFNWSWMGPKENLESRRKRGIVEDCCMNPCTIDVLMSYC